MLKDSNLDHTSFNFREVTHALTRATSPQELEFAQEWTKERASITNKFQTAMAGPRGRLEKALQAFGQEIEQISTGLVQFAEKRDAYEKMSAITQALATGAPIEDLKSVESFLVEYLRLTEQQDGFVDSAQGTREFSVQLSSRIGKECESLHGEMRAHALTLSQQFATLESLSIFKELLAVDHGEGGRARFIRVENRAESLAAHLRAFGTRETGSARDESAPAAQGKKVADWNTELLTLLRKFERNCELFIEAVSNKEIGFNSAVYREAKPAFSEPEMAQGYELHGSLKGSVYLAIARHLDAISQGGESVEQPKCGGERIASRFGAIEWSAPMQMPVAPSFEQIAADDRKLMLRRLLSEYPRNVIESEIRRQFDDSKITAATEEARNTLLKHLADAASDLEVDVLSLELDFGLSHDSAVSVAQARFVSGDLTGLAEILNDYPAQAEIFAQKVRQFPELLGAREDELRAYLSLLAEVQKSASELSPLAAEYVGGLIEPFRSSETLSGLVRKLTEAQSNAELQKSFELGALLTILRKELQPIVRDPSLESLAELTTKVLVYGFAPQPGEKFNATTARDATYIIKMMRREASHDLSIGLLTEVLDDLIKNGILVCADRTQSGQLQKAKIKIAANPSDLAVPIVSRLTEFYQRNFRGPEFVSPLKSVSVVEAVQSVSLNGHGKQNQVLDPAVQNRIALDRSVATIESLLTRYRQLLSEVETTFAQRFEQLGEYRLNKLRESSLVEKLKVSLKQPLLQQAAESMKYKTPFERECFKAIVQPTRVSASAQSVVQLARRPAYHDGRRSPSAASPAKRVNVQELVERKSLNFHPGFPGALEKFKALQQVDASLRKAVDDPLVRERFPWLEESIRTLPVGINTRSSSGTALGAIESLESFLRPLVQINGSKPIDMLRAKLAAIDLNQSVSQVAEAI